MGHIGNVYTHFCVAVGQPLKRQGIVEVLGVIRINGEGCHRPEVASRAEFLSGEVRSDLCRLGQHIFGESIGKIKFGNDGVHFHSMQARPSEYLYHLTDRTPLRISPRHHFNYHLIAVFCAAQRISRYIKIRMYTLV